MVKKVIGILALQGCVEPHFAHFKALNCSVKEVRKAEDFKHIDGLVLPGGESTTMLKLIHLFHLKDALIKTAQKVPTWGICAGAILMAKEVTHPSQESLELMDISIQRNGYGSQKESFQEKIQDYEVSFIRAPLIQKTGTCTVKATYQNNPVWLQQDHFMVTTFHPELNCQTPSPMHKKFTTL